MRVPITALFLIGTWSGTLTAQVVGLVVTSATDLQASMSQLAEFTSQHVQVDVVMAPGCYLVRAADASVFEAIEVAGQEYKSRYEVSATDRTNWFREDQQIGALYLNALLSRQLDGPDARMAMDWSGHPEGDHVRHADRMIEHAGAHERSGGAPPDWTCSRSFNSEYMVGTVVASTFFVESDGSVDANSYSWSNPDINSVKLQIIDAWSIWSYTAGLYGRSITAIMNWAEPAGGITTQPYEPVLRPSTDDHLWIGAIMSHLGYGAVGAVAQVAAFNADTRGQLGTQHAVSAFVAYNPPALGAPAQFADGKVAYAYLGGPYQQLLFKNNGWNLDQLFRIYGHETAHLFHAFDEYAASAAMFCTSSFNNRSNNNHQGPACNGTQSCIMVGNTFSGVGAMRQWDLCPHTPYHIGWTSLPLAPVALSPINDVVITQSPAVLRWDRMGAGVSVYGYVKVYERTSGNEVACLYAGSADSVVINLVNGEYEWVVGQGSISDHSGQAGRVSDPAPFRMDGPLLSDFSVSSASLCAGSTVSYADLSTGSPSSWNWSFPGGAPATHVGQTPPPITYLVAGSYSVTLLVGDGVITNSYTMNPAVTVIGGDPLPFSENFNSGLFPPASWLSQTGMPGTLAWQADFTAGCSYATSAYVPGYNFTGGFSAPTLTSKRIDLTTAADPYLSFDYSYARRTSSTTESLNVHGRNCEFSIYPQVFTRAGAALATNGGALLPSTPWVPSLCSHWKKAIAGLHELQGHTVLLDFRVDCMGGQNVFLDNVQVFQGSRLNLRVLLEGPYLGGTGLMRDDLRTQGVLPATEPYTNAGFTFHGEGGDQALASPSVLSVSGSNAVVDWVVVEVRDAVTPSLVLTSRAALIQRDGDIVDTDGTSQVRVGVPAGSYHLSVRHRNHLGIMTAAPVAVGQAMALLDLSLPGTATYGAEPRKLAFGKAFMWAGDGNADGTIRYTGTGNDRDPILAVIGGMVLTNTASGYMQPDLNMDGVAKYTGSNNDRDPILTNIGGAVQTAIRYQQLP